MNREPIPEERILQIARVVHAANRELQVLHGDEAPSLPWDSESEEIRQSAVNGVRAALAGATPEELHDEWCRFKASQGWKHGEFKDPVQKRHPCLVPHGQLPPEQREKDAVFTALVRAMAPEAFTEGSGSDPWLPVGALAAGVMTQAENEKETAR